MSRTTLRSIGMVVAAILGLQSPVSAQRVQESVQVTVVEVPVTVVDRAGNAVRGLTADDFELLDEGKRRQITYFETIDLAIPLEQREDPLPPAATRNFLLLFDLSHSSPTTIGRSREAAAEFVTSHLGERDLASVATFSVEQGIRMLTSFTADRELLRAAIETLGHPNYFRVTDPLFMSAQTTGTTTAVDGVSGDARSEMNQAVQETAEEFSRADLQANTEYKRNRLKTQLSQFGTIARVLDRLPGQKQVILLSEGFDASLLHGREDIGAEATQAQSNAGFSGEVWKIDNDQRFGNSSSNRDLTEMVNLFRRSDVTLHSMDIKGLRTDVDAREGFRKSSNEALFLLSNPTGGTVFKNVNDLGQNFETMMQRQEVIYLLGFQAETDNPGKFHEIKVKTKGVRGARVDHRSGYYEPTNQLAPIEKTITAASVLLNDIPQRDIQLQMTAAPFPLEGGRVQVPVVLEIDGEDLLEGIEGSSATGEIFIYAFDESDTVGSFNHQKISLDLEQVREGIGEGIRYYGTLMLAPGTYSIKSLVRVSETNRMGFMRKELTVPDFSAAAVLPPMLFGGEGEWMMLRAEGLSGIPYPFVVGAESFIPRAEKTLSPEESYRMTLFTYNVPPEKLGVAAVVRPEGGAAQPAKVALLGRTPADEQGGVKYLFDFKPENLAAGNYKLEMTVTPEGQTPIATSVPFVVR